MYLFMPLLMALVTVALYIRCDVKHSPVREQLSFFWQLHPCNAAVGLKILHEKYQLLLFHLIIRTF